MGLTPTIAQIASAGIGAGTSLLGSIGSALFSTFTNKSNRKWQEYMYDRQLADQRADTLAARQWQEKQAEIQRDWSSAKSQVERLKAAGLNPALAYGSSGVGTSGVSATTGTMQAMAAPSVGQPPNNIPDFSGMSQAGSIINQGIQAAANYKLSALDTKSKINARLAENERNMAEAKLSTTRAEGQSLDNAFKQATMQDRIDLVTISKQQAQVDLDTAKYRLDHILPNMTLELQSRVRLMSNQCNQRLATITNLGYQNAKLAADTSLSYEMRSFYGAETNRVILENQMKPLVKEYLEVRNGLIEEQKKYTAQLSETAKGTEEYQRAMAALARTQESLAGIQTWGSVISSTLGNAGIILGVGSNLGWFARKGAKIGYKSAVGAGASSAGNVAFWQKFQNFFTPAGALVGAGLSVSGDTPQRGSGAYEHLQQSFE